MSLPSIHDTQLQHLSRLSSAATLWRHGSSALKGSEGSVCMVDISRMGSLMCS